MNAEVHPVMLVLKIVLYLVGKVLVIYRLFRLGVSELGRRRSRLCMRRGHFKPGKMLEWDEKRAADSRRTATEAE